MRARTFNALAGSSLLAFASAAGAQTASGAAEVAHTGENETGRTLNEIIVTARRREESLQDVPQTVDAVTSAEIQKLTVLKFEDLSAIVPGLSLASGNTGYNATASMRGVTYNVTSQANPTVALYINDAPIQANFLFQSLFDVGQVEVLRGPQGTLHGESAPSGAITLTTHKADLSQFEVFASATESSSNELHGPLANNIQAAVNLPVISDLLAVRVAGLYDGNDYDGIHSVHNSLSPYSGTKAGRVSVTFQPVDALTTEVMYQHLDREIRAYQQVTGVGAAGGTGVVPGSSPPTPYPPAGYNGPDITTQDRLAVQDGARNVQQKFDVITGKADLRVAGQRLSYAGSYSKQAIEVRADFDTPNMLPGTVVGGTNDTHRIDISHELRIASEERVVGLFDYTVGAYFDLARPVTVGVQPASYLLGAFGFPVQSPNTFNSRYVLPVDIYSAGHDKELSEFASLTAHLGDRTDLTFGGRRIHYTNNDTTAIATGTGQIALPLSQLHLPSCGLAGFGSTYPGTCNVPVKSQSIQTLNNDVTHTPTIYDISLDHHFSDELMVYATTGSAWRAGPAIAGLTNGKTDATFNSLVFLHPEESHAYELGVKAAFFDKRALVNVAVFHQYFDGLIVQALPTPYINYATSSAAPTISENPFVVNANSVINGLDADASWRIARNWTVAGAFSYANGHMDHASVPCIPPGFNGTVASYPAGALVFLCKSNAAISQAPSWNASIQSEYSLSLSSHADGYLRGLLTYYPENPNASQGFVADRYALLNLYLGLRDPQDRWDVSLFARNVTNRRVTLSKDYAQLTEEGNVTATFGPSGYYATTITPPLEVGVNIRYSFVSGR